MSTQLTTVTEVQNRLIPFFKTGIVTNTGSVSGFKAWCLANGHNYDDKEVRSAKSPQSKLYKQQKVEARPVLKQLQAAVLADPRMIASKLQFCTKKDKVTGQPVFNGVTKMVCHLPTKADEKLVAGDAKRALEARLAEKEAALNAALAKLAALEAAK